MYSLSRSCSFSEEQIMGAVVCGFSHAWECLLHLYLTNNLSGHKILWSYFPSVLQRLFHYFLVVRVAAMDKFEEETISPLNTTLFFPAWMPVLFLYPWISPRCVTVIFCINFSRHQAYFFCLQIFIWRKFFLVEFWILFFPLCSLGTWSILYILDIIIDIFAIFLHFLCISFYRMPYILNFTSNCTNSIFISLWCPFM